LGNPQIHTPNLDEHAFSQATRRSRWCGL
jgi:hypothetical protein